MIVGQLEGTADVWHSDEYGFSIYNVDGGDDARFWVALHVYSGGADPFEVFTNLFKGKTVRVTVEVDP